MVRGTVPGAYYPTRKVRQYVDITDRTKVEWVELFSDLEHQGLYEAGEIIGLGVLVCENCGHKTEYTHPTEIIPCIKCGKKEFSRQLLKP